MRGAGGRPEPARPELGLRLAQAAKADLGQALEQTHARLFRCRGGRLAAGAQSALRRKRQLLDPRHARAARGRTFGGRRDESARRRLESSAETLVDLLDHGAGFDRQRTDGDVLVCAADRLARWLGGDSAAGS